MASSLIIGLLLISKMPQYQPFLRNDAYQAHGWDLCWHHTRHCKQLSDWSFHLLPWHWAFHFESSELEKRACASVNYEELAAEITTQLQQDWSQSDRGPLGGLATMPEVSGIESSGRAIAGSTAAYAASEGHAKAHD